MPEIASVVIRDILGEILVAGAEQPIEGVDSSLVIRTMNRFMSSLAASGISLGYTKINNPSEEVTVPDGALDGIIYNVALKLSSSYDIPISPMLQQSAADGMKAMRHIAVKVEPARYPYTLPIGSGNEWDYGYDYRFYPPPPDEASEEEVG